jgi:hypothetical protein
MCWTSYTDDGQVDEYRARLTTEAYMVYFGVDLSIRSVRRTKDSLSIGSLPAAGNDYTEY